jgi:hypothetical protein
MKKLIHSLIKWIIKKYDLPEIIEIKSGYPVKSFSIEYDLGDSANNVYFDEYED